MKLGDFGPLFPQHRRETMNDVISIFSKKEALCQELKPFVTDGPMGKMIHHKWIIDLAYTPGRCAYINQRFDFVRQEVQNAWKENKAERFVFLHERPYRLEAMRKWNEFHPDKTFGITNKKSQDFRYWNLVKKVWMDSENIYQHLPEWIDVWNSGRPGRELVMQCRERTKFKKLPDQVSLFRGVNDLGTVNGLSWTLRRETADWFARRWARKTARIISGTVPREKIIAVFIDRKEDEVVCDSVQILDIEKFRV